MQALKASSESTYQPRGSGSAAFQTCCIADFQIGRTLACSEAAGLADAHRVWKPAIQQTWKSALWRCACFALVAALAGCSKSDHGPSGAPIGQAKGAGMPVPVATALAFEKTVPLELSAIGSARALASVAMKTRVDGQLARVACNPGDEVKKGDLIFEIDPRPFQTSLRQAEAVLARDVASLENAETDMKRTDELAGTKAVPATVVDANRAKVASLKASVEAGRAAVHTAELQLSFCSITSPVTGRVGLLQVDEGNMVKNNDTILAVVNQTKPIFVDFAVPERVLQDVRDAAARGHLRVEASPPQRPDDLAVGALEVINNQVDATTGTLLLRARFENADERLWPGQFLNVTLALGQLTNATVVPSPAVQTGQNGEFVFVVKPDATVEKRPVTLGPLRGAETVIQSGVKPGEKVVTDGQLRLVPGAKVSERTPGQIPPAKPKQSASFPRNADFQPGSADFSPLQRGFVRRHWNLTSTEGNPTLKRTEVRAPSAERGPA